MAEIKVVEVMCLLTAWSCISLRNEEVLSRNGEMSEIVSESSKCSNKLNSHQFSRFTDIYETKR